MNLVKILSDLFMIEWTERSRADQASLWKVRMTLVWGREGR